jgi:REP element-mobilizing transposase RayT
MKFDPDERHRQTIRLKDYDYSQAGAYFVTVCTQGRECLFGEITDGNMRLNEYGRIVRGEWLRSAEIRREIELDEWVVMPNHIHAIIAIIDHRRGDRPVAPTRENTQSHRLTGPRPKSISALLAGFKSAVTKQINQIRRTPSVPVWQRNYYEHIIRNEDELNRIRQYIANNPAQWALDRENPAVGEKERRGDRPVTPTDDIETICGGVRP